MADYHSVFYPEHTLESFEARWSPPQWRSEAGGYAGIANWRDEYGQGSRTFCGHKHNTPGIAIECVRRWHQVRTGPYERAL